MSNALLSGDSAPDAARRTRQLRLGLIVAVLLLAAFGVGSRLFDRRHLAEQTQAAAIPIVTTLRPAPAPGGESLLLPGTAQAYAEAAIYARTSGYVKSWKTDLGARVRKGALLAEIDTPDVDQQFHQAQADVATARASYEIARTTDLRWRELLVSESVSKQDAEQKAADAASRQAALQSAEANLARLRELQGFKRILAPFDGVVTQRATDVGALVSAGQNAGAPLFRVADVSRLRIYAAVPEAYAAQILTGTGATINFDGRPGKYKATVTSTAGALDPATRSLQIELQMDNVRGALLAGAYARVHFDLGAQSQLPRIPVTALLFRGDGLWVATVGEDHHVALHKIIPGRDFGTEIEIQDGVGPGDVVVADPPDSLMDGALVRIAPGKTP
ncbi:MAG: efflux RND transporter periplasmic adaptor subunit [Pseudomonadota bacterium]|jgi:hypothetical protein